MKRLFVLATVIVLLALMVSSVSANVVIDPPTLPEAAGQGSVSPEEGKASPILFGNGAASGAEDVVISPPDIPYSVSDGEDRPTDEVSLNGGTIIKIVVPS